MLWLLLHSACTASNLLSPPSPATLGADTDRTAEASYPKGYSVPYDLMLSNKNSGKGGTGLGGEQSWLWHVFPSNHYMCWGTTCPKVSGRCLTIGSSELIYLFAFLGHKAFAFLIKVPLPSSTSLLAFLLFTPHPTGEGSAQEAGWVLGC